LPHRGAVAWLNEGGWLRIASELAGLVGFERNGFFRTQMFEREGGGDEGGQKWSACVRLGSRKFRKIKNLVLPMRVREMRQGEQDRWDEWDGWVAVRRAMETRSADCGISKSEFEGKRRKWGRLARVRSHLLGLARVGGGKFREREMSVRRGGTPRPTRIWRGRSAECSLRSAEFRRKNSGKMPEMGSAGSRLLAFARIGSRWCGEISGKGNVSVARWDTTPYQLRRRVRFVRFGRSARFGFGLGSVYEMRILGRKEWKNRFVRFGTVWGGAACKPNWLEVCKLHGNYLRIHETD
jgi:hypothetical protein